MPAIGQDDVALPLPEDAQIEENAHRRRII
jgi:hypothetical protein